MLGQTWKARNMLKQEQILTPRALYQQMKDETLIIHSLSVMNEECLELSYDKIVEDAAVSATTNTFLPAGQDGACTTTWTSWIAMSCTSSETLSYK